MNPKHAEISNWELAEMVYTLRLLIDRLERRDCTEKDKQIIFMAYRSLQNTPPAVQDIVNQLEQGNEDE